MQVNKLVAGVALVAICASLTNDTISGNRAGQGGGGIAQNSFIVPRDAQPNANQGMASGARLAERVRPRVTPSTGTASSAGSSGGQDDVSLGLVTLAANSSASGGGILNGTGFAFMAHDTIVATNSAASRANCAGTVSSGGHNLESARDCGFGGAGDVSNSDPLLAGLSSNGGPTQTMALEPGRPAIDAGDPACPQPGTDQRGTTRRQGTACDIGAFESMPLPAPPRTGRPGERRQWVSGHARRSSVEPPPRPVRSRPAAYRSSLVIGADGARTMLADLQLTEND
jgi:hypothetical protein